MAATPRQSSGDLGVLYDQAAVAQKQLGDLTRSIADELGGSPLVPEKLKGRERTQEKIDADYKGEVSRITDLARSTIVFDSPQQITAAMARIRDRAEVVRLKDRFAEPAGGYRDVMMNLRMPNGHIVEIQLHLKSILDVKNGPGHKLYEDIRTLDARAKRENRRMTEAETKEVEKLQGDMKKLYDKAFKDSGGEVADDDGSAKK